MKERGLVSIPSALPRLAAAGARLLSVGKNEVQVQARLIERKRKSRLLPCRARIARRTAGEIDRLAAFTRCRHRRLSRAPPRGAPCTAPQQPWPPANPWPAAPRASTPPGQRQGAAHSGAAAWRWSVARGEAARLALARWARCRQRRSRSARWRSSAPSSLPPAPIARCGSSHCRATSIGRRRRCGSASAMLRRSWPWRRWARGSSRSTPRAGFGTWTCECCLLTKWVCAVVLFWPDVGVIPCAGMPMRRTGRRGINRRSRPTARGSTGRCGTARPSARRRTATCGKQNLRANALRLRLNMS